MLGSVIAFKISGQNYKMIYEAKPDEFNHRFETASCFMESSGDILLLLRQDQKPEGNKWGIPAGKVDAGENPEVTVRRELFEETSYEVGDYIFSLPRTVYVRYPDYDFIFHMYRLLLNKRPEVRIRPEEHKEYGWFNPGVAVGMPLVMDFKECIQMVYNI